MMKPRTRKILHHVTAWTIWFAYEFVGYYDKMAKYTLLEWSETAYNCISLIIATYATINLARKFCDTAPSYAAFLHFLPKEKFALVINKYILGIFCVIVVYMGLSFWLENQFFGMGYKEIFLQLKGRSHRLSWFILGACFYGYHKSHKMKSKQQIDIANYRVKIYQNVTDYLKTLIGKPNVN